MGFQNRNLRLVFSWLKMVGSGGQVKIYLLIICPFVKLFFKLI